MPHAAIQEKRINNKYTLTSIYGQKLQIELDYTVGSSGYINNQGYVQYIATNVGLKDIKQADVFIGGSVISNHTTFDSAYMLSSIVFEFTTSDNKMIEASAGFFTNGSSALLIGKSTQAETVRIDAGNRFCVSVKPIRIEFHSAGLRAHNSR